MKDDRADQAGKAIDGIARRYLWLVIPLISMAVVWVWNPSAAIGFGAFILFMWAFAGAIWLFLRVTQSLLARHLSPERQEEVQQSIGLTLFLGGCAATGMAIQGENAVSRFVEESKPEGFNLAFVDPTFALICIAAVWVYTIYRLRK